MKRDWSLRGRLTRLLLLGVGLGWLTGLFLAIFIIAHEMNELVDRTLKESAQLALSLYGASEDMALIAPPEMSALRVMRDGQQIVAAPWPALDKDGAVDVAGWRVYRLTSVHRDQVMSVEAGQSNRWRQEELIESIQALLVLMLPVLAIVLLSVGHSVATALAPALGLADNLRDRKASDLSPVGSEGLPRELMPIPQSLNGYLLRIGRSVEAERQFATNAAHELRTPLASASAQAQLIAAGMADDGAPRRMAAALDRLTHLIERLLQLSRAEAGIGDEVSCDLLRVIRLVIAEQPEPRPIFDDGDIERAEVAIHPDAVALIVGNLLRNASQHGAGRAQITLRPGPVLRISNPVDGKAGFRLATFDKAAGSGGTGLGLTIVQTIAERDGIGLDFRINDGVATVELRFPTGP